MSLDKREKKEHVWFKVKRGWRNMLYFIYEVMLVIEIDKGFPENWLETCLVTGRYSCS